MWTGTRFRDETYRIQLPLAAGRSKMNYITREKKTYTNRVDVVNFKCTEVGRRHVIDLTNYTEYKEMDGELGLDADSFFTTDGFSIERVGNAFVVSTRNACAISGTITFTFERRLLCNDALNFQ